MELKLTPREQGLLNILLDLPPNFDKAEHYIRTNHLDGNEVTKAAIEYSHNCFWNTVFFAHDRDVPQSVEKVDGLPSSYLFVVTEFLLKHGLDPNGIYDDYNIMENMQYVDNELIAADTLALLLEHGGKTDLMIPGEGTLFDEIDGDVFYGTDEMNRVMYRSLVHCWMVLIGYGARCDSRRMHAFREFDSVETFAWEKLKNHRNYNFGVSHLEKEYDIRIYDKETMLEVARIE